MGRLFQISCLHLLQHKFAESFLLLWESLVLSVMWWLMMIIITCIYKAPFLTGAHSALQLLMTFTMTKYTSATDFSFYNLLITHTRMHTHTHTYTHTHTHTHTHTRPHAFRQFSPLTNPLNHTYEILWIYSVVCVCAEYDTMIFFFQNEINRLEPGFCRVVLNYVGVKLRCCLSTSNKW